MEDSKRSGKSGAEAGATLRLKPKMGKLEKGVPRPKLQIDEVSESEDGGDDEDEGEGDSDNDDDNGNEIDN